MRLSTILDRTFASSASSLKNAIEAARRSVRKVGEPSGNRKQLVGTSSRRSPTNTVHGGAVSQGLLSGYELRIPGRCGVELQSTRYPSSSSVANATPLIAHHSGARNNSGA